MWRFLVPAVFAAPLLWTVVAEWRLVVDGPPPSGGTSGSNKASPEKCDPETADAKVKAARNGYRAWAAVALRIDDENDKNEEHVNKDSRWENLCAKTKERVKALGDARQFSERYRKGEDAGTASGIHKRALEQRKVDVELLGKMWRKEGKWNRVEAADELDKLQTQLGQSKDDVNRKAREKLRKWVEVNDALNKTTLEYQCDLLRRALDHIIQHRTEPPFETESVKQIVSQVKQLNKFKEMSEADLGGLLSTVQIAFTRWEDFTGLVKDLVEDYKNKELLDKIRDVDKIVAQLNKIEKFQVSDEKLAAEAKRKLRGPTSPVPGFVP